MSNTYQKATYRIGPQTFVPLVRGRIEAFTDQMSNAVSMSRIDVRAMLKQVQPGALPLTEQGMRFFLHETTHHATFANKVGRARSALATSVAARAHFFGPVSDGLEALPLGQRDDLVLRFFGTLFEPLIEGLALFAEHDIRWGPLDYTSHPLLHLFSLFLHRQAADAGVARFRHSLQDDGPFEGAIKEGRNAYANTINEHLRQARTGDYWIEQKVRLLCQPLKGNAQIPPYLLGYLAVKRAYLVLRSVNHALADSDLFLMTMLNYWFSDEETAELLVSLNDADVMSVQGTLQALANRFQDMWDELYQAPSKALSSLVKALSQDQPDPSTLRLGHFDIALGVRTGADMVNVFVPRFHKYRLYLRVGVIRVDIQSDPALGVAIIHDTETSDELLRCPIAPLAERGTFPGTIEVVRSYDGRTTALVIVGLTGLVAVRDLFNSDWNPPEMIDLFDDFPSIEHVQAAAEVYQQSPYAGAWQEGDFAEMNEDLMEQAIKLRDLIYLQLAFPGAREKERAHVSRLLGDRGFKMLFETEVDLKDLALLTLRFGGPGASIEEVGQRLEGRSNDVESFLKEINNKSQIVIGAEVSYFCAMSI